jgi:hypothetical protein
MSANDPKRTSCRGAKVEICVGLSIVVNRLGATCNDVVKTDGHPKGSAGLGPKAAKRQLHTYQLTTHQKNLIA